jgi:osmoprotectant transport system substrate-binding protein
VPGSARAATLAETLVFGSGAECPSEPFCLPALERVYGLTFHRFVVCDPGGPRTVDALVNGNIDVGVLFTTDPQLVGGELCALLDDRASQPAEHVVPVARADVMAAHGPGLAATLDALSARLTTARLAELNRRVALDGAAAAEVADRFVAETGTISSDERAATGPRVVVGSADFSESATIAEVYAAALVAAGFSIERRLALGNRDTYLPLLRRGEVGLVPEYQGSLLGFLDPAGPPSTDAARVQRELVDALAGEQLLALAPAAAETKNAVVVTRDTAERYGLVAVSDLARRS